MKDTICLHVGKKRIFLKEVDLVGTYLKYKIVPIWATVNYNCRKASLFVDNEWKAGRVIDIIKKYGIYMELKFNKYTEYAYATISYDKPNEDGYEDSYAAVFCLIPTDGVNMDQGFKFGGCFD